MVWNIVLIFLLSAVLCKAAPSAERMPVPVEPPINETGHLRQIASGLQVLNTISVSLIFDGVCGNQKLMDASKIKLVEVAINVYNMCLFSRL